MNLKLTGALALVIATSAPILGMQSDSETEFSVDTTDQDTASVDSNESTSTKIRAIGSFLQRNAKNSIGIGLLSALAWYVKTHPGSVKLTTKNSMLLGALSAALARYTWDSFYTNYKTRVFNTKIDTIVLAFDQEHSFKNKQCYTVTVDLQNSAAPITIAEQAQREEKNPFAILLPTQITLNQPELPVESALTRGYKKCTKALTICLDTVYRDPLVLIGPVATALVAVMGRQTSHKVTHATAAASALALVAFSAQQFMRKFTVEIGHYTRKTILLNAIHQIVDHARTYTTDLKKLMYSVAFDFETSTATITLELPRILTQDTLPPYTDAKECQLKVPAADFACQTDITPDYPRTRPLPQRPVPGQRS